MVLDLWECLTRLEEGTKWVRQPTPDRTQPTSEKILLLSKNIVTGETSQAITPFHFFKYYNIQLLEYAIPAAPAAAAPPEPKIRALWC